MTNNNAENGNQAFFGTYSMCLCVPLITLDGHILMRRRMGANERIWTKENTWVEKS